MIAEREEGALSWLAELTTNERRVFTACVGGWALDAMNVQLYSFVIPALIAVWGLTRGEAGVLGTAALLVSALGGWVAGWFADRFGRVLTLQIAILCFAVFTFPLGGLRSKLCPAIRGARVAGIRLWWRMGRRRGSAG